MKTEEINDYFVKCFLNTFDYLKTKYGFKLLKIEKNNHGCYLLYKKKEIEIGITFSYREGGILIRLSKIPFVSKIIPLYPGYNWFYLNSLIYHRTSKWVEQDLNKLWYNMDSEYTKKIIETFSEALKCYAGQVLEGNIQSFSEIAKELDKG